MSKCSIPHRRRSRAQTGRTRPLNVYAWCMGRTNIDLDDQLIAEVMRRFGVSTKKEAVDLALRRLVGVPLTSEFLLGLEGLGWEGDLESLRREKPDELS
jgi:Arc/MetJ family transcription regulator